MTATPARALEAQSEFRAQQPFEQGLFYHDQKHREEVKFVPVSSCSSRYGPRMVLILVARLNDTMMRLGIRGYNGECRRQYRLAGDRLIQNGSMNIRCFGLRTFGCLVRHNLG